MSAHGEFIGRLIDQRDGLREQLKQAESERDILSINLIKVVDEYLVTNEISCNFWRNIEYYKTHVYKMEDK